MINRRCFGKIIKCLNFKPTVDLIATIIDTKLPHFISLRPNTEFKGVKGLTLSR